MIPFLFLCTFGAWVVGAMLGVGFGWKARHYHDRRCRHYYRRGAATNNASGSGLSVEDEPTFDVDSIIDPTTRAGVRRLMATTNNGDQS